MVMKVKVIVIIIVLIQIAVISFLVIKIINKPKVLGTATVNNIKSINLVKDPTGELKYFYEPSPNSKIIKKKEWDNSNSVYQINSGYMNQITDFPVNKKSGVFRIAILGDSFTFGENVNTQDNYPSKMQALFNRSCENKVQVLNFGVSGFDFRYTVERYFLHAIKYNPDLVIWFIIDIIEEVRITPFFYYFL
jgi:hypothetical protein